MISIIKNYIKPYISLGVDIFNQLFPLYLTFILYIEECKKDTQYKKLGISKNKVNIKTKRRQDEARKRTDEETKRRHNKTEDETKRRHDEARKITIEKTKQNIITNK